MATLPKICAAFGIIVTALSSSAVADTYHHIDELALSIQRQSRELICETRHYRHTPEYRHLVADTRDMYELAAHIHDLAHHHGSIEHLESDVAELDAKFHHLESVFDRVERRAAHGHGHVHGNTAHVKAALNSIEDSIHHLQDDLRSLRGSHRRVVVRRPSYVAPKYDSWDRYRSGGWGHGHDVHDSHVYGSRGRSFSIGGGSSRFTFRF